MKIARSALNCQGPLCARREFRGHNGGSRIMQPRSRFFLTLGLSCVLLAIPHAPSAAATTGAIQGVVSDPTGHPVADVQVAAAAPSYTTKTVTGSNGFYAVNGLPLDTYTLTFTKTGYQIAVIA